MTTIRTSEPPIALFALRSYQERIANTAVNANTLVVLPTGAGKTLIAATAINRICGPFDITQTRDGPCALFLVPTRLLVKQQATALRRSIPGAHVAEFAGGLDLPSRFDVLVTTPKAFEVRQQRDMCGNSDAARLDWAVWDLLVFDEVHHVLKDHPYRRLALSLRDKSTVKPEDAPRIIGLTASYTYAVGEAAVLKSLRRMCDELCIEKPETADQMELESSGYHAKAAAPEIHSAPTHAGETLVPVGVLPEKERKPHLMIPMPIDEVLGISPYSMRMRDIRFEELAMWYEGLRILVTSWEEGEDATALFLRMSGCETEEDFGTLTGSGWWSSQTVAKRRAFWADVPQTFPRFERLKEQLLAKEKALNPFRGILFVQQRITTHILEHFVKSDVLLAERFTPTCVYAAATPATVTLSVSRSETDRRLAMFGSGAANLLIATAVAEEGMDIPTANCVIRFDAVLHTVSLVQGRGRARQQDSSLIVLSERADRSVSRLQRVEEQQLELVRTFQPVRDPVQKAHEHEQRCMDQRNREQNARTVLTAPGRGAAAAVQLFARKTKVDILINMHEEGNMWCCELSYSSVLRSVTGKGFAEGKKGAKLAAMEDMLASLRLEFVS
eukprot:IDg7145t1